MMAIKFKEKTVLSEAWEKTKAIGTKTKREFTLEENTVAFKEDFKVGSS